MIYLDGESKQGKCKNYIQLDNFVVKIIDI
jgi:hypothetical protein